MTVDPRLRQRWAQALRSAPGLSMTARMVGQVLALDFANRETGLCNPSRAKIAKHMGVSEATVKRALAELTSGGWLRRASAPARDRSTSYVFLWGAVADPAKDKEPVNAGQDRPASEGPTRVISDRNAGHIRPAPIENQVLNQFEAEASPPPTAASTPSVSIWAQGLDYLMANGVPERRARPMLGRWRREYGETVVVAVMAEAERHEVTEPVAWITAALKRRTRNVIPLNGGTSDGADRNLFGAQCPGQPAPGRAAGILAAAGRAGYFDEKS